MNTKINEYTVTSHVLSVSGRTWGGYRANHVYELKPDESPSSLRDCKRIAGDFESLTSAVIKTTRQEITEIITSQVIPLHVAATANV